MDEKPLTNTPRLYPRKPYLELSELDECARYAELEYEANPSLLPDVRFIILSPYDKTTIQFLANSAAMHHSSVCSWFMIKQSFLKPLFQKFISHTDVNGLLSTGELFLISTEQFHTIMKAGVNTDRFKDARYPYGERLLDIGAGYGNVTAQLAPSFATVTCTEMSWAMRWRLRQKGYNVYSDEHISALPAAEIFDVITLFNVIDRCARPIYLLKDVQRRVRSSDSKILIATPLPLDPWVETGLRWIDPDQSLVRGVSVSTQRKYVCCQKWEESVMDLVSLFRDIGFRIESVSRLPYLSAGDPTRAFYVLDDALFVLSVAK
jgi:SAM-dependent methyltransferase